MLPTLHRLLPAQGTGFLRTLTRQRDKPWHHAAQKPGQPDGLTAALVTDAVHTVIPVTTTHQWQSMHADSQTAVNRARRMFIN